MTDTPNGHKATPEQWQHLEDGALIDRPYNSARVVLELRDRIAHLEQMRETEKAAMLDIYAKLERLKLQHESNWARIVKLEEAQEAAPAAEPATGTPDRDDLRDIFYKHADSADESSPWLECEAFCDAAFDVLFQYGANPAAPPATAPAADDAEDMTLHTIALCMVDSLRCLGVLPEILDTLRRAIREPMVPGAEPAPQPAGSLVEAVAALIANGIACDREEERIAVDAIAAVAEWLERHHTDRIANGSQFADLLREGLDREAGR